MRMIGVMLALVLAACDGPKENAGEKADFASGAVNSEDTLRQGPAEALGEKQDAADESRQQALEAKADSLEAEADAMRAEADQAADALDEQAARVRGR